MFDLLNAALSGMVRGPRPLSKALSYHAEEHWSGPEQFSEAKLLAWLLQASPGDETLGLLRKRLAVWDNEEAEWTEGVERNTPERRELIYRKLGLSAEWVHLCEQRLPFHRVAKATVIAEQHAPWYTDEIREARNFYWTRYAAQLAKQGWPQESILELDASTTSVVERLADPSAEAAYQAKGLVVGYVQSGKTANFTGVIAKAADAGYKLIIVLGGMWDVLRSQTQRRIDKELIGRELLGTEYMSDPDYADFVSHGAKPSQLGAFDFYRLTGSLGDYERLAYGMAALQFQGPNPDLPYWHKDNLLHSSTRIAVLKKHSAVLQRLLKDLNDVGREQIGAPLDHVPALIIDDESDQASINVKPLNQAGQDERTATNNAIVELLRMLPRAQYVGYTATPFANVFVDPSNEEDIFPKDFLIALPRPSNYMGVSDFYDLDVGLEEEGPNRRDYVRAVEGADDLDENLPKAIDTFVLAGAIKLFRAARDPSLRFRHHTMLVHLSQLQDDHKQLARAVRGLYAKAGYDGGPGLDRLQRLFEDDFAPVHSRRGEDLPFPACFEDLEEYLGECLQAIGEAGEAVLVLNTEHKSDAPDFDKRPVWKILVGGTKLSRGYTVEGLTVSYYRRRAGAGDTLMQMGRWFGFRRGYRDLVRLFIGTKEPVGRSGRQIDLYEAFGAICRDEEFFRKELERYASMDDPRITPAQIPPLVPQHMLRPTAPNKMRNAVVEFRNFGAALAESTFAPTKPERILKNVHLVQELFGNKTANLRTLSGNTRSGQKILTAWTVPVTTDEVIALIERYTWFDPNVREARLGNPLRLQLEFLKGRAGDHQIRDWLLFAPKISENKRRGTFRLAGADLDVVYRSRHDEQSSRFNTYNDPVHRAFAQHIASQTVLENANDELRSLRVPHRGVLIFYPVTDEPLTNSNRKAAKPPYTMAFTYLFPPNDIRSPLGFSVRRTGVPAEAIVSTDD